MRIHVYHHHDPQTEYLLKQLLKRTEIAMALIDDLNTKIDGLVSDLSDLSGVVDAFIKSDADNFQALKDALANGNAAAIQAAIDKLDAARAALAAQKDKIVAADAADNL